jgi:hypothetical protein
MRRAFALGLALAAFAAFADQRPVEIDQNTKIQGGADVRESGANAGAGARSDDKVESEPRPGGDRRRDVAQPDKMERREDWPISERRPREPEPLGPARGDSAPPAR